MSRTLDSSTSSTWRRWPPARSASPRPRTRCDARRSRRRRRAAAARPAAAAGAARRRGRARRSRSGCSCPSGRRACASSSTSGPGSSARPVPATIAAPRSPSGARSPWSASSTAWCPKRLPPAQLEDALNVIDWVRTDGRAVVGDGPIVLIGESAGVHARRAQPGGAARAGELGTDIVGTALAYGLYDVSGGPSQRLDTAALAVFNDAQSLVYPGLSGGAAAGPVDLAAVRRPDGAAAGPVLGRHGRRPHRRHPLHVRAVDGGGQRRPARRVPRVAARLRHRSRRRWPPRPGAASTPSSRPASAARPVRSRGRRRMSDRPPSGVLPFRGVRVLDLAAPVSAYCGRILAGYGADVLRLERPGATVDAAADPRAAWLDAWYAAGCRRATLDFADDRARPAAGRAGGDRRRRHRLADGGHPGHRRRRRPAGAGAGAARPS